MSSIQELELKRKELTVLKNNQLSDAQLDFLNANGWFAGYINGALNLENKESESSFTCKIGTFAEDFAILEIDEIIDNLIVDIEVASQITVDLTDEEILEKNGFTVMCQSPHEIEDSQGNYITGQCADWLTRQLVTEYKQSLMTPSK